MGFESHDPARGDALGGQALAWAVHGQHIDIVRLLLSSKYPPGVTWNALVTAYRTGNPAITAIIRQRYDNELSEGGLLPCLPGLSGLPNLRWMSDEEESDEEVDI